MRGPFKTDGKLDEFASSLLGQRTKNLLDSKPGGRICHERIMA